MSESEERRGNGVPLGPPSHAVLDAQPNKDYAEGPTTRCPVPSEWLGTAMVVLNFDSCIPSLSYSSLCCYQPAQAQVLVS